MAYPDRSYNCRSYISDHSIYSSLFGRYNFQVEKINIGIKDLDKSLDGLKIIHLSDLHLSSFYKHRILSMMY
jgi:predicted MPP superfamily phosphohydrolase